MIEVQIEGDTVVKTDVFDVYCVALNHAESEGDWSSLLAPNEEAHLVGHQPSHAAEIFFCQLLKVKIRSRVDLQIERVEVVDEGGCVPHDAHFDGGRVC